MDKQILIDSSTLVAINTLTLTMQALQFELSLANDLKVMDNPKNYRKIRDARTRLHSQLENLRKSFDGQIQESLEDKDGNSNTPTN